MRQVIENTAASMRRTLDPCGPRKRESNCSSNGTKSPIRKRVRLQANLKVRQMGIEIAAPVINNAKNRSLEQMGTGPAGNRPVNLPGVDAEHRGDVALPGVNKGKCCPIATEQVAQRCLYGCFIARWARK